MHLRGYGLTRNLALVDHRSNRETGIDNPVGQQHLGSDAVKRLNDGDREKIREERMRE
jgi:hypothetical protein